MLQSHLLLASAVLIITDLLLRSSSYPPPYDRTLSSNITGVLARESETRSLILPLSLSSPRRALQRRRMLHGSNSSYARMPLYDDLLLRGYYTTRLFIGTPPQEFALIVDTGSTVTYVPCSSCQQCGRHQDPRFRPEQSSTYKPVKCNIDCSCDEQRKLCTYERRYAEMSSSSGVLGDDIVSFGSESELQPQHVVFGCENVETGDLFSQRADGIMGLGRGPLSIMDQLVDKGSIENSFSLCYGGMGIGGGAMILGAHQLPNDMVFTLSDPNRSPYYNIELKGIHVAGKPLKLRQSVFDGKHGTVLDSGTTYTYLPKEAFVAFRSAILKSIHPLRKAPGPDPNYNDICFAGAGRDVFQLNRTFPQVELVFHNGQKLLLSPENYLFRHTKVQGAYCLGIFQNGKDPTTLLGGIIVRNTLVTYDRANKRVGFWKTNCSDLWRSLHFPLSPAPAPAPAPAFNHDKSVDVGMTQAPLPAPSLAPSSAPSTLTKDIFSWEFRVGVITFDMDFFSDNSSMKPKITELAAFIADELDIDTSQVHLLNFTYKEKHIRVKWAIYPANSSSYITDTKAMSIILHLTKHRLKLPAGFGGYKLVQWKVEPQTRKKPQLLVVFIGGFAVFALILSSFGIWFTWSRRQQALHPYEPVGSAVAEQELQPLGT